MFNSIRIKIFLLFTLGLTLITAILILIFTSEINNRYKELFIERAEKAANQLAFKTEKLFELGLFPEEFIGYEILCENILKENEGIIYTALLDKNNKPIFYAGDFKFKTSIKDTKLNDLHIYFSIKDSKNLNNKIFVIVDEKLIKNKTYDFLENIIGYSLITILFIIIGILLYLKVNLSNPLSSLLKRIKEIELNKSSNKKWLLLKRKDEIGTIAKEFEKLIEELILHQESLFKSNKELSILNRNLDNKVKKEVQKNREKDLILFEQAKMASMGEMISNIAHQWRQPLSVITTSATGLKFQKDFGEIEDKEFYTAINNINEKAQHLSKIIDNFRIFLADGKEIKEVIIQKELEKLLEILSQILQKDHIDLKNNIDYSKEIKIKLISGELNQAILNITNNARDILIQRKINNPWIKFDFIKDSNKIILTIEDNAGGISDEVLPHIFEPYFTTKHQAQGVGLGLNFSYRIITDLLNGKIYAKNTKDGIRFFIEIPTSKQD